MNAGSCIQKCFSSQMPFDPSIRHSAASGFDQGYITRGSGLEKHLEKAGHRACSEVRSEEGLSPRLGQKLTM